MAVTALILVSCNMCNMENLLKILSDVFIQFHWVVRKDSSTICTGRCPVLNNFNAYIACLNGAHVSHLTLRVGREPNTYVSHALCVFFSFFVLKYCGGKS